jgi:hypothetical protein
MTTEYVEAIVDSVEFGNATHPYNSTATDFEDLRALIAREVRRAQAAALREAADEYYALCQRQPFTHATKGEAAAFTAWLRARADALDSPKEPR